MKKILAVFLCAAMALSLSACSGNNETPDNSKDNSVSDSKKDNDNSTVNNEDSSSNNSENSEENSGGEESKPEESKPEESKPEESSEPVVVEEFEKPDLSEYVESAGDFDLTPYSYNGADVVRVVGYHGSATAVKIPAEFDGRPVYSVDKDSFTGSNVEHVMLPEGIVYLNGNAFANSALKTINIPDSITSISPNVFDGTPLKENQLAQSYFVIVDNALIDVAEDLSGSVVIPNGVTRIITAFFQSNVESVTIPNGVTFIGDQSFYGCPNLKNITIPNGVTAIGANAFASCSSLESVEIPEGVTSIGRSAFRFSDRLIDLALPDSLTSLGDDALPTENSLSLVPFFVTYKGVKYCSRNYPDDSGVRYTLSSDLYIIINGN